MVVEVALSWITAVFLCSIRLGALLLATPILDGFSVPARIKVVLIFALSVMLVCTLDLGAQTLPATVGDILIASLCELATGALLAFGVFTAFGAVALAGKVLDIQIGFGIANVFDPVTHTQSPLIGSVLGTLAVLLFFLTDAHHALLRGIAFSLTQAPLGSALTIAPELLIRQFGSTFTLALLLASPVVFCIFFVEVGLAVISRNLPQVNIFVIGLPVKIAASFLMLAAVSRHLGAVFNKIFSATFLFWEAVL